MLRLTLVAGVLLLLSGCDSRQPVDREAEVEKAAAAIQTFASALKKELSRGMQEGGPVSAIDICNDKAASIAATVSTDNDLTIGRVSAKFRNPGNAPNQWQSEVLESFEQRKAAGEDASSLVWSEITDSQEFRFMKAIPTGALCLSCHGEDIPKEVQAKLAELYPLDRATNFRQGDLRGAFVVTRSLQ